MELILWRHCDAEAAAPDASRRLTPRGHAQAHRMAGWLTTRLPAACRMLVSPAVRAQQTAAALRRPFETARELAPGATAADVLRIAGWPEAPGTTLIVGHEPTLSQVAARVLSDEAAGWSLDKGAVVWLATPDDGETVVVKVEIGPDSVAA